MIFGYEKTAFVQYGVSIPISLGIDTYPHVLLTGASGCGKSQSLLFLIGKLLQDNPKVIIFLCDFKNSEDFSFLKCYTHYYAGKDCYRGLMEYYTTFSKIREEGYNKKRFLLIFDEYPAFINALQMQDKINKTKLAADVLGAVSEILMLGRGIRFGIWIVTQRADSSMFLNGSRDNFMIGIGLGRLSKEQKGMIFPGQEIPDESFAAGEGMLLADGKEITTVKYPIIRDMADWKEHIIQILMDNHAHKNTEDST